MADDVAFRITGGTETLKRMVQVGKAFTDQSTGGAAFRANIYLVADKKNGVTVTAEDQYSGITFTRKDDVKVNEEGSILVHAIWIDRALSVLDPNAQVTISFDNTGKKMVVEEIDGDKVIRMSVPPVGENTMYPKVEAPDSDSTVSVSPDKLNSVYNTVAVARDISAQRPILSGVLMEPDKEAGLIRFMGSNGSTLSSTESLKAKFDGDGEFPRLVLDDSGIRPVFDHIGESHHVDIRYDEDARKLHFFAYGDAKGKDLQYHIKVSPMNIDVNKYPAARLRESLVNFIKMVHTTVRLDKMELQRVLKQASDIGSLDVDKIGGMAKNVNVVISPSSRNLTASVDTAASYTDSIDVEIDSELNEDIEYVAPWGIQAPIVASYHNEDDPSRFEAGIISKDDVPIAMLLYKDSLYSEEPDDDGNFTAAESLMVMYLSRAQK